MTLIHHVLRMQDGSDRQYDGYDLLVMCSIVNVSGLCKPRNERTEKELHGAFLQRN